LAVLPNPEFQDVAAEVNKRVQLAPPGDRHANNCLPTGTVPHEFIVLSPAELSHALAGLANACYKMLERAGADYTPHMNKAKRSYCYGQNSPGSETETVTVTDDL
jgi:hypothetical protein